MCAYMINLCTEEQSNLCGMSCRLHTANAGILSLAWVSETTVLR